jgi:hypothetical protein
MSELLQEMLAAAAKFEMSASDVEEQRRSFAYGNANIENDRVTRELVDRAAEELKGKDDGYGS